MDDFFLTQGIDEIVNFNQITELLTD